jgi:succinyl-CoA synthetase beta subunit
VITSPDQARQAYEQLGGGTVVVKAQVHAGGRGKAGYVVLATSADQVDSHCQRMFSQPMVSAQTGPEGVAVRTIMLAQAVEIDKEFYLGVVLDRSRRCPVMMASAEGGVEIEQVAAERPEAIHKAWFHKHLGIQPYQARQLAIAIGLTGEPFRQAVGVMMALGKLFVDKDCSLAEINPLVTTTGGQVLAIDAKFNFDDSALFRHADVKDMFDPAEENPAELRAAQQDLSYIGLDGNIGCLVNGAGLAMATMDIIKLHGGEPANFLDVGGSVTPEAATEAFRIILADQRVKGVLVNIFGGIARCDTIAEALIVAGREIGFTVPVVVRLEGTNVDKARQMLADVAEDMPTLVTAEDLADAARRVCQAV